MWFMFRSALILLCAVAADAFIHRHAGNVQSVSGVISSRGGMSGSGMGVLSGSGMGSMSGMGVSTSGVSGMRLRMAEEGADPTLLEQMRKALGEKDDIFGDVQEENRVLLQGLRDMDRYVLYTNLYTYTHLYSKLNTSTYTLYLSTHLYSIPLYSLLTYILYSILYTLYSIPLYDIQRPQSKSEQ
jgi:hypothetical protein